MSTQCKLDRKFIRLHNADVQTNAPYILYAPQNESNEEIERERRSVSRARIRTHRPITFWPKSTESNAQTNRHKRTHMQQYTSSWHTFSRGVGGSARNGKSLILNGNSIEYYIS